MSLHGDNFSTAFTSHQDWFGETVTVKDSVGTQVGSDLTCPFELGERTALVAENGSRYIMHHARLQVLKTDLATWSEDYTFTVNSVKYDIMREDGETLVEDSDSIWIFSLIHAESIEKAQVGMRVTG